MNRDELVRLAVEAKLPGNRILTPEQAAAVVAAIEPVIRDDERREAAKATVENALLQPKFDALVAWADSETLRADDAEDLVTELRKELDAEAKHAALKDGEFCDVCTHREMEELIAENEELERRVTAARAENLVVENHERLEAARAEGWDEGCRASEQYYQRSVVGLLGLKSITASMNPYRTEESL